MIPFAEWRPDMPALGQWAREALNVVPADGTYRPHNADGGAFGDMPNRLLICNWQGWRRV